MNNMQVTKSQVICNILCALVWSANVILRIYKHPDDKAGMIIWAIGAVLWIVLAILNFCRYQKQIKE